MAQLDDAPLVDEPPNDLVDAAPAPETPLIAEREATPALESARSQLEALIDEVAGMDTALDEVAEEGLTEPEAEGAEPLPVAETGRSLLSQDALDTLLADEERSHAVLRPHGRERSAETSPPVPETAAPTSEASAAAPETAAPTSEVSAAAPDVAEILTSDDIEALLTAVDGDSGDSATST